MSSVNSLLRSAAVYSTSNILNALIPFLLLPILTRVLPPSDYGLLAMFFALLGILSAFTGLSVHGAVNVRFVDRKKINFPRYVGSCFYILLASTLLTLVLVMVLQDLLVELTALPPVWLFAAVLVSGLNFIIQIHLGIWMMEKRAAAYGIFQVLLSLLNIGLSLWFVLSLKQGYEGRLWGQVVATAGFALISAATLYRGGWLAFSLRMDYVREALVFGIPLMPHVIGAFLASLADRFVINQQLGLAAAGVYMVAAQLGMGMGLLADAFNKAYIPWIYEQLATNKLELKQKIVKLTWAYFLVSLCVAGLVASLSETIVMVVAGIGYAEAAKALRWLALGQAFCGMYFMVTNFIFFTRKTACLAWVTLLVGVVGIVLAWFLTPFFGISGAGAAFAISMFLRFVMTWLLAQRVYPMPWFCVAKR